MPLVIDASLALALCLKDEDSAYARTIAVRLSYEDASVPEVWPVEVANGLVMAERRSRLLRTELPRVNEFLLALPVRIEGGSLERSLSAVLDLASRHELTAYDASYLELARRASLPLATLDGRLRQAAEAEGVPLAT